MSLPVFFIAQAGHVGENRFNERAHASKCKNSKIKLKTNNERAHRTHERIHRSIFTHRYRRS
jgi:hypothetical protein